MTADGGFLKAITISQRLSQTPDIIEKARFARAKTQNVAKQICDLINDKSQLSIEYSVDKILMSMHRYRYLMDGDTLIAVMQIKKVQWYQYELQHLAVSDAYLRQGYARKLIDIIESEARNENARILQCTIRSTNEPSIKLFLSIGFTVVNNYYNSATGNTVLILQKVVSEKPVENL